MNISNHQITEEEKKRRKKEKKLAQKYSDEDDLSDVHEYSNTSSSNVNNFNKNRLKTNTSLINGSKISSSSLVVNGHSINSSEKDKRVRETPERVCVEDVRHKFTTMKASDYINQRNFKFSMHNDQMVAYSVPPLTNGTTTLTQSSGLTMSTSTSVTTSASIKNIPVVPKKLKKEIIVETIYEPEQVLEAVNNISKTHKRSGYKLNREEILRRCNHDVARMMGKHFLDDQVCTKNRYVKLLLKSAVQGDVKKFQQLFDAGYNHLRSIKALWSYSNNSLKRLLMFRLLRIFVDQGTDSNLFMLLSGCYQRNDDSEIISCNKLSNKHGYCKLIEYLSTFFKPTELKSLLSIRNCYSGRTAFSIASVAGNLCQQKILLQCGSNADIVDDLGYSPLHYIIKRSKPRKDMFHSLLHWGADISIHLGNCNCNDTNFVNFIKENYGDEDFGNFVIKKLQAIQSLYISRADEILKSEFKKVIDVASALHTTRAFTPRRKFNYIEIDFELDLTLLNTLKTGEELLLYIIPLRFRKEDSIKGPQNPQIDFIDLKEVKEKIKAEILHDILLGIPRFFSYIPTQTVIDFQHSQLPKTTMTHYSFKLKKLSGLPPQLLRGKLHFSTKCDEKQYKLFNDILFGIQAIIISENITKNKKDNEKKGKKNKNSKNHQNNKNKQNNKSNKNNLKNINRKEKEKRAQKGNKAE